MADGDFIIRRPRHEASIGSQVIAELLNESDSMSAELADLSRLGLKLIVNSQLAADDRLRLRVTQPANHFQLELPITVRWCRPEDNGRWGVGCVFDCELSWETMGELFLNGILCMDEIHDATPERR